jgi:lipoyl(octanoyl) transferase
MRSCLTIDLGLIAYAEAWELQKRVVAARKAGAIDDVLLFCEHPHVITLGRSGKRANLLAGENVLRQKGVEYFETPRGGDITYHGPGQIVGYPILNLGAIKRDVVWYVRMLEEAMIRATAELGIAARREEGKTGIWVPPDQGLSQSIQKSEQAEERTAAAGILRDSDLSKSHQSPVTSHWPLAKAVAPEKLAAIGVHISRWVTSHGFAYNVATDLRYFELIVPCGIAERKATSLEKLLERRVGLEEVKPLLARHLGDVFDLQMQPAGREELLQRLERTEQAVAVA